MLVLTDKSKRATGTGVQMFSRAGKSTVNKYLNFGDKPHHKGNKSTYGSFEDDDFLNDDINKELKMLMEKEKELNKVRL